VLPGLMDTPSWAGRNWSTIPADPSEYAQFTAKVVERYGPGGIFWQQHPELDSSTAPVFFEIWNEPYYGFFSDGDADPGRYARLYRAAAAAGRAANPSAKFLIEADVSATDDWSEWHNWITAMFDAVPDLGGYIDAVAVHPYVGSRKPPSAWDPGTDYARYEFPRMAEIRREVADNGVPGTRLWITEVGWSTCVGDSNCVSEAKQADYLQEMFEMLDTAAYNYVDAVFYYHRSDLDYGDPANKEGFFGLQRLDGSHKPAFDVFRARALASG
jgi:hypothetical protein